MQYSVMAAVKRSVYEDTVNRKGQESTPHDNKHNYRGKVFCNRHVATNVRSLNAYDGGETILASR